MADEADSPDNKTQPQLSRVKEIHLKMAVARAHPFSWWPNAEGPLRELALVGLAWRRAS